MRPARHVSGVYEKVAQECVAVLGQDRLGVELHADDPQVAVPDAHDLVDLARRRLGPRGDLQGIREASRSMTSE